MSSCVHHQEGDEDETDEAADAPVKSHPDADTTIIFTSGEGFQTLISNAYSVQMLNKESNCSKLKHVLLVMCKCVFVILNSVHKYNSLTLSFFHVMHLEFPANEIVRFLVGFSNKGSQAFTVQSLEASFRYPQDFQFYIQNVSVSEGIALRLILLACFFFV